MILVMTIKFVSNVTFT